MKNKFYIISLLILILGFALGLAFSNIGLFNTQNAIDGKGSTVSSYSGEEMRGIVSLSGVDIEGLLKGEGTPFGGMAKLAELNGYPGPRHVLDLAQDLNLSDGQKNEVEELYDEMKSQAIKLGEKIIEKEEKLDNEFKSGRITETTLRQGIDEGAKNYADLRFLHLKYHLFMMGILNDEQVKKYNSLRGYTSSEDPCENIPEGHDLKLWKMHNGCI
jgi:hypothetical protein